MIIFENEHCFKTDLQPFLYKFFFKDDPFWKKKLLIIILTIVNEGLLLRIDNKGLSLKTNFIKTVVFWKKDWYWKKITCNFIKCCLHEVEKIVG